MKQRILTLCVVALAMLGCTSRPVAPRFETLVADTTLGQSPVCRVDYIFTTITNAAKSTALKSIEQTNIDRFFNLDTFDGTAAEAMRLALDETSAELLEISNAFDGHDFEMHVAVESEASVVDTLVNYIITRSSYLGGAHGVYSVDCHNYSLSDGREIRLGDIFTRHEQHILKDVIRKKLYESYNATDDEALREAGFFPDNIGVTDNFRPTAVGLTLHYNPYDIGCYALGGIEVSLTHREIDEVRKEAKAK